MTATDRPYLLGYAVVVGAASFAFTFGDDVLRAAALALGAGFGATVTARSVPGRGRTAVARGLAGYALGAVLSLLLAAGLVSTTLGTPFDVAVFFTGIRIWLGWVVVATVALLSAVVAGVLT